MKLSPQQIAEAFSFGRFDETYPYLSDAISWEIVNEKTLQGKDAVIENCDQTAAYFKTVTTQFNMLHCICSGDFVVINGTAEFINANNKRTSVSACDMYRFENGLLAQVTSYCIVMDK
jgi:SnoaL-like domain